MKKITLNSNNMELKITTGNFEIINSGTVVGNHNEQIIFVIQSLTYMIEFRNDTATPGSRIDKEVVNNMTLKLILINFNNSLGTRNTTPLSIGTISNRRLFLNFSADSISDTTGHIFHYSFLLEMEA